MLKKSILTITLMITSCIWAQNIMINGKQIVIDGDSISINRPDSAKVNLKVKKRTASYGGLGGFMIGAGQIDLKNLNSSLKQYGYKEFDDLVMTTGGGGWGIVNNLMFGGEGHGVRGLAESGIAGSQRYKMTLKMDYGMFDLGYQFYNSRDFNSYIMGGIGHNKIEFRITEDRPDLFGELLADPKRDLILNKETYLVDLSLGGNYMYHFGATLFLGLKTGYVFAFDQDSNENNILDCPAFGVTGSYAKFFIGFGGGNF